MKWKQIINWKDIEKILHPLYPHTRGQKELNPTMMFRVLLIQTWYNLGDPETENALVRDILFRKFVGLDISDSVPDHSTIWKFREKLQKRRLNCLNL